MRQRFLSVSLGITVYASSPAVMGSQQMATMPTVTVAPVHIHTVVPTVIPAQTHNATTFSQNTTHHQKTTSTTAPTATTASNLNLNSSKENIDVSALGGFHQLTINLGGKTEVVTLATKLTGAEAVAVAQVADGEKQTIVIGADGKAVGGSFDVDGKVLASIDQMAGGSIASLVVPKNVTLDDSVSQLNLAGGLINNGHIVALSNGSTTLDTIKAQNIANNASGTITTGKTVDLTLQATTNISNAGQILASSNLNVSAGTQITNVAHGTVMAAQTVAIDAPKVTNAGTITATDKNVDFSGSADISLNNTGGTVQAQHGDIDFRDSSYAGSSNINVTGGSLLSQNLNLYTGTGTVTVDTPTITGAINGVAGAAHVNSSTENLKLGNLDVSGDPTYYNQGNIIITNNIAVGSGQNLAIVASGNVTSNGGVLNTSSNTGNGGSIFISAGDPFTTSDSSSSGTGNTTTTLTLQNITAPTQTTGGFIDLTGGTTGAAISAFTTASTNGAGGNVTLLAFSGTTAGSGTIKLPTAVTINTSSFNGVGGNVTMYAGAQSSGTASVTGISMGSINANGGGISSTTGAQNAGGTVDIETGNPQVTAGGVPSGNITVTNGTTNLAVMHPAGTPNTVLLSTTNDVSLSPGTISVQNISSSGGNVSVIGQSAITVGTVNVSGAGGLATSSTAANNAGIGANAGSVTISVQAFGSSGITTGNILAYGGGGAGGSIVTSGGANNGGAGGNGGTVDINAVGKLSVGNINTSGGGGGGGAANGSGGTGGAGGNITIGVTVGITSSGVITSVNGGNGGAGAANGGGGGGGGSYGAGGGGGAGMASGASASAGGGGGGGGAVGGGGGGSGTGTTQQGGAGGGFNGVGAGGIGSGSGSGSSGFSGAIGTGGAGNGGSFNGSPQSNTAGGQGLGIGGTGGSSISGGAGSDGSSVTPQSGNFAGGNLGVNLENTSGALLGGSVGTMAAPLQTMIGGQFTIAGNSAYILQGGAFNLSTTALSPVVLGNNGNLVVSAFGNIIVDSAIGDSTTNSITLITQAGSGGNIDLNNSLTTGIGTSTYINLIADGSVNANASLTSNWVYMTAKTGTVDAEEISAQYFGGIAGGSNVFLGDFNVGATLVAYGTGSSGTSNVDFRGANNFVAAGAFNAGTSVAPYSAYNASAPNSTLSVNEAVDMTFALNGIFGTPLTFVPKDPLHNSIGAQSNAVFGSAGAQGLGVTGGGVISGANSKTVFNAALIVLDGTTTQGSTSFGTAAAPLNVQTSSLQLDNGGTGSVTDFINNTSAAALTVSANNLSTLSLNTSSLVTTLNGVTVNGNMAITAKAAGGSFIIGTGGVSSLNAVTLSAPGGITNNGNGGSIQAGTLTLVTANKDMGTISDPLNIADSSLSVNAGTGNVFLNSSNSGPSNITAVTANTLNYQGVNDVLTISNSIAVPNVVLNVASISAQNIGTGKGAVVLTTNGTGGDGGLSADTIDGTSVTLTTVDSASAIAVQANTPILSYSTPGSVSINLVGTATTTISTPSTPNPNQGNVEISARAGLTIATGTELQAGAGLTLTSGGAIQNSGTIFVENSSGSGQLTINAASFNNGTATGATGTITAPVVTLALASTGAFNNNFLGTINAATSFDFGTTTHTSGTVNNAGIINSPVVSIFTPTLVNSGNIVSTSLSVSDAKGALTVSSPAAGVGSIGTPDVVSFSATGNLTLGNVVDSAIAQAAGTASPSSITLNSGGILKTDTGIITATPSSGNGGIISINAATWNFGATGPIQLVAASTNTVNGGSVNLHLTGTQNLSFVGGNEIVAGNGTGNGGTISVSTGGSIVADNSNIPLTGIGQVGGNLSLIAGGTLLLNMGASPINLTGTTSSGNLVLSSGSTSVFNIGAAIINGVSFTNSPQQIQASNITITSPNVIVAPNETIVSNNKMQFNTASLANSGFIDVSPAGTLGIQNTKGALIVSGAGTFSASGSVDLESVGNLTLVGVSGGSSLQGLLGNGTNSLKVVATNGIFSFGSTETSTVNFISVTPDATTDAGGNISITAASLTGFSALGSLNFLAEAGGGAGHAGGNISLTLTGTAPLSINVGTGNYAFANNASDASGAGGTISISTGGNLLVNSGGLATAGMNPNVSLVAGTKAAGILNITDLQGIANQAANGSMNLTLGSNSASAFTLADATANTGNGATGADILTANNLVIQNLGGSITAGTGSNTAQIHVNSAVLQAGGAGVIGTSTVPFAIDAGTLTVLTAATGSANINDSFAGPINLISASTGKSFTFADASGTLNVLGSVNATAFNLNGAVSNNPITTNATTISANVGNSSLTLNDTATTAVSLGASTAGSYTLNASGAITTVGAITAPVVNLNAGGKVGSITIGAGIIGETGASVSLAAAGTGVITDSAATSGKITGNTVSLNAVTGAIGASTRSLATAADNMVVATKGAVFVTNTDTDNANVTFSAGTSSAPIGALTLNETVSAGSSASLGNIYSSGNISISSNGAQLQLANGANINTKNGNIVLLDSLSSGVINFQGNNAIGAFSPTAGSGNVTVAIGVLPKTPVPGTAPAGGLSASIVAPGKIFYGQAGILGILGNNSLTADGANIIFNNSITPPPSGSILFNGNVNITADPPTSAVPPTSLSSTLLNPAPNIVTVRLSQSELSALPVVQSSIGAVNSATTNSQSSASLPTSLSSVKDSALNNAVSINSTLTSTSQASQLASSETSGVETSNTSAASVPSSYGSKLNSQSLTGGVLKNVAMRSTSGLKVSEASIQELKNGAALLSPKELSTVKTPFGIVKLMPHTVALLIVNENGLSIFNLNENRVGSIKVENGGLFTSVCVGQSLHLSSSKIENFEDLNPVQCVGYRNVSKKLLGQDITVFRAEYSITTLMGGLAPLRDMASSSDKERRTLADRLIKTVALMSQMGQQSRAYELMQPASVTAMARE